MQSFFQLVRNHCRGLTTASASNSAFRRCLVLRSVAAQRTLLKRWPPLVSTAASCSFAIAKGSASVERRHTPPLEMHIVTVRLLVNRRLGNGFVHASACFGAWLLPRAGDREQSKRQGRSPLRRSCAACRRETSKMPWSRSLQREEWAFSGNRRTHHRVPPRRTVTEECAAAFQASTVTRRIRCLLHYVQRAMKENADTPWLVALWADMTEKPRPRSWMRFRRKWTGLFCFAGTFTRTESFVSRRTARTMTTSCWRCRPEEPNGQDPDALVARRYGGSFQSDETWRSTAVWRCSLGRRTRRVRQRTDGVVLLNLYEQSMQRVAVRVDLFGPLPDPQPGVVPLTCVAVVLAPLEWLMPLAIGCELTGETAALRSKRRESGCMATRSSELKSAKPRVESVGVRRAISCQFTSLILASYIFTNLHKSSRRSATGLADKSCQQVVQRTSRPALHECTPTSTDGTQQDHLSAGGVRKPTRHQIFSMVRERRAAPNVA